jgi:hypothetical protein
MKPAPILDEFHGRRASDARNRARLDADRIETRGDVLHLGNSAYNKNHAGLKYTYNVDFKEMARNHARDFIVSH